MYYLFTISLNMGFVDKSSWVWVSIDKKFGQDAEGNGCGLD
jgi:hypothetical protein